MKLQEIMVANVLQASPEESIGEAAKRMREKSVGCLVVTVDGAIKGIITDRDLLVCLEQRHDPYQCEIAIHMSQPVIVLRPEENHRTAADVMRKNKIKRLPVVKSGKLLGIVSMSDLASLAEGEIEKLWPSWTFITGLIRTQAVQGRGTRKRAEGEENVSKRSVA